MRRNLSSPLGSSVTFNEPRGIRPLPLDLDEIFEKSRWEERKRRKKLLIRKRERVIFGMKRILGKSKSIDGYTDES